MSPSLFACLSLSVLRLGWPPSSRCDRPSLPEYCTTSWQRDASLLATAWKEALKKVRDGKIENWLPACSRKHSISYGTCCFSGWYYIKDAVIETMNNPYYFPSCSVCVSRQWRGAGGSCHTICPALYPAGKWRRGRGGLQDASPHPHCHPDWPQCQYSSPPECE